MNAILRFCLYEQQGHKMHRGPPGSKLIIEPLQVTEEEEPHHGCAPGAPLSSFAAAEGVVGAVLIEDLPVGREAMSSKD